MDLATLLGLLIGIGSLLGAHIIEATSEFPTYFYGLLSVTAAMIVYGGTVGALLITFPLEQLLGVPKAALKVIFHKEEMDTSAVVDLFVHLAEKARREGLLSLEE
ncbi:MAG: motility protein A, partial [Chloroflexi bacterium]|nr:motility protein A [Chloroflexota bacterium]